MQLAEDGYRVVIDPKIFSIDTVKRTLLKMSAEVSGDLTTTDEDIVCTLFRKKDAIESLEDLEHHFRVELLDEDLREKVAAKTESLRNIILAHTFSKTTLADPPQ